MTGFQAFPEVVIPECQNFQIQMTVGSGAGQPTASGAFPTTNIITNQNILVNGTFTIDKDITFDHCRVFFGENAEMVTQGSVDLEGINSLFRNCEVDKAWRRIQINADGALRFEGCTVAGALDGLDFRRNYRGKASLLKNNFFSYNRFSIICIQSSTLLAFREFIQNRFHGNNVVPGTGTRSTSAIRLIACKAVIGTPVVYDDQDPVGYIGYVNTIRNFRVGIESYSSTTTVTNCRFEQMRPEETSNGTLIGCGISAIGGSLTVSAKVQGLGSHAQKFGHCEFYSCAAAGIRATSCRLNVSRAEFTGEQIHGIVLRNPGFRSQIIEHNDFTVGDAAICEAGIFLQRPNGSGNSYSTIIRENNMTLYSGLSNVSGIDIRCPVASTDHIKINNNYIDLNSGNNVCFGIIVFGEQSNNIELWDNEVEHLGSHSTTFGVFLASLQGEGHLLAGNESAGYGQCNYHLEKSRNVQYCSNISNIGVNGFHFYGDNDNAFWSQNDIGRHSDGLLIESIANPFPNMPPLSTGKISTQTRKGNLWEEDESNYSGFAARCTADPNNSEFIVENNSAGTLPTKTDPLIGWFNVIDGQMEVCGVGTRPVSQFEEKLAQNIIPPGTLSAAETWEAKRVLMQTLIRHPELLNTEQYLQDFYNQNLNTSAGQFAQINSSLENNSYFTSAQWTELSTKVNEAQVIKEAIDDLNAISQLSDLANGIYYLGDPALFTKFDEWGIIASELDQIEQNITLAYATPLSQALQNVNNIPLSQPFEQAYKTLKTYEIKLAQGLAETQAGYADIENLANLDESIYGSAVRSAKHYLNTCERYERIAPNESGTGTQAMQVSQTADAAQQRLAVQIQPNPAKDIIQVSLGHPIGAGKWFLHTASGILAKSGSWMSAQNALQINTEELLSGAYFLTLIPESGERTSNKVIILR